MLTLNFVPNALLAMQLTPKLILAIQWNVIDAKEHSAISVIKQLQELSIIRERLCAT